MRTSSLAGVVAVAAVMTVLEVAGAAAQDSPVASSRLVTLTGCVAQTADGALQLLTTVPPASTAPRSTGSNSAKASTPIGNAVPVTDRPRTPSALTPKGSTPIQIAPVRSTSSGTGGANSPKASTPVGRNPSAVYALDARGVDVAAYAGQTVEVTGELEQSRLMRVEALRPVAATCAQ